MVNMVALPPPCCEVLWKDWSQVVVLAFCIKADYSCATAPDLHRLRLLALPSGGSAPGIHRIELLGSYSIPQPVVFGYRFFEMGQVVMIGCR